jgi:hypothetical protein
MQRRDRPTTYVHHKGVEELSFSDARLLSNIQDDSTPGRDDCVVKLAAKLVKKDRMLLENGILFEGCWSTFRTDGSLSAAGNLVDPI